MFSVQYTSPIARKMMILLHNSFKIVDHISFCFNDCKEISSYKMHGNENCAVFVLTVEKERIILQNISFIFLINEVS